MTDYTIILFLPHMVISPPPRMWSDVLDSPNGDHVNHENLDFLTSLIDL